MLNELRDNNKCFYKNILKWNLTRYNLQLEIILSENSDLDQIIKVIQDFGFCNDWSFLDNNAKFICKWDIRRIKNIKHIEPISELLVSNIKK